MTSEDNKEVRGDQTNINTSGGPALTGNQIEKSPVIMGSTVTGPLITADNVTYYHPPATPLDRQQQRNRRAMLAKVKAIWIDGLLKQSLAEVVKIDLGLVNKHNAV